MRMFVIFRGECVTAVMSTQIMVGTRDIRALGKHPMNGEKSHDKHRGTIHPDEGLPQETTVVMNTPWEQG